MVVSNVLVRASRCRREMPKKPDDEKMSPRPPGVQATLRTIGASGVTCFGYLLPGRTPAPAGQRRRRNLQWPVGRTLTIDRPQRMLAQILFRSGDGCRTHPQHSARFLFLLLRRGAPATCRPDSNSNFRWIRSTISNLDSEITSAATFRSPPPSAGTTYTSARFGAVKRSNAMSFPSGDQDGLSSRAGFFVTGIGSPGPTSLT